MRRPGTSLPPGVFDGKWPQSFRALLPSAKQRYYRPVRAALIAIVSLIAAGVVACSGDGSDAAPLTLEERLLLESEAAGSEPDPQETRVVAGSLDDFVSSPDYVVAADIDRSSLEEAGFVSAVQDTRFYPETPGASHSGEEPHVRMVVIRFDSEDGARAGSDLLHEKAAEPCLETCATRITEFDVAGIPDAKGVRRLISEADLEETGEARFPFDVYAILFADGSFAYQLDVFGTPGEVSQEQAEEIAMKVYERVQGAPAPG